MNTYWALAIQLLCTYYIYYLPTLVQILIIICSLVPTDSYCNVKVNRKTQKSL